MLKSIDVFNVVKKIPKGKFLSYFDLAKKLGNIKYQRAVAKILTKNRNPKIPCHRIIYKNGEVGGYFGHKNWDYIKAAKLLAEGAIGVIPTDTIYGICASAFNKKAVEKVYKLRKRNPQKPCIILISNIYDLKQFGISLNQRQKQILQKIWPSKISVILKINNKKAINKFNYLHRGTNTLAFRFPKNKLILKILKISGSLIAPSANFEGQNPALSINQSRKYFKNNVFYLNRGKLISKPSTILDLTKNKLKLIRKGADFNKIKNIINSFL
ncbi:MAG: L-threonylcarbamoyladenylate synthase [Minisyncoccia bacterium]